MDNYPTLSRKPSHEFSDEKDPNAVLIGSTASGYPVLNKVVTLDLRTFTFDLRAVTEADKLTIFAFYESHKEIPFYWLNVQDSITYVVAFMSRPTCKLDGRGDLWRIGHVLKQTSSEIS